VSAASITRRSLARLLSSCGARTLKRQIARWRTVHQQAITSGRFRLGTDQLLCDAQGKSHISMEDFAIAMVDELERHAHSRQRFTVGY
jgi:hypothetical protein